MIAIAETLLSMALTLLLLPHGGGNVWTPTFKGTPTQRYMRAVAHYQGKMGLQSETFVFKTDEERNVAFPDRCAQVESYYIKVATKVEGFDGVEANPLAPVRVVRFNFWAKGKGCSTQKPEFWALHETCHVRWQHHLTPPVHGVDRADVTAKVRAMDEQQEREVAQCMTDYSAKERR